LVLFFTLFFVLPLVFVSFFFLGSAFSFFFLGFALAFFSL